MADKTEHEATLSRSDAAEYLRSLAVELDGKSGPWTVPVGNKQVTLQPEPMVDLETTVNERSRLLGDDRMNVVVELSWSQTDKPTDGSESDQ